ncbi:Hpt domain-containing protein [Natrinema versiforme]|uniref:Chemotaxis protein CheA n=1 Tax=Natrinema versiforme TaxID=88724 RepID=A0A4P8WIM9_9EURY|nr:Hpt domain-containing protein [Natrinema versiforme]QCS43094.1 chemotaxis protein CheA [Natrinema versiforme]
MTDYLTDFVQESEERITELNNALLTLERDPDDEEAMENIFRIAHTLKGNCGAMGLESASDLAHAIEDLLDAVRANETEVTAELMDVIFDAVDELETMVDEVAESGEIETDPSATIEALRDHLADADGAAARVGTPTTSEIDDVCARFEPPADDAHNVYLARLAIAQREGVNNGELVVDALIDAFDLIGTEPPREAIEAADYGTAFDAVFGTAVGEAAISSGLEPVEEVDDFEIVDVSDRFETAEAAEPPAGAEPGDDISSDEAQDLEVDDLLDEFNEFDNLDEMVEDVEDEELDAFEDMGEAGSFDDLLDEDDVAELEAEPGEPPADSLEEDEAAAEGTSEADTESDADDADEVDDAGAVFDELKDEVEMVGFDELQDELEELEFDEFDDEEEVDMDELLGDDADDDSFLDDAEPSESAVDDILVDAESDDGAEPSEDAIDEMLVDAEPSDDNVDEAIAVDETTAESDAAEAAQSTEDDLDDAVDDLAFDEDDVSETGDDDMTATDSDAVAAGDDALEASSPAETDDQPAATDTQPVDSDIQSVGSEPAVSSDETAGDDGAAAELDGEDGADTVTDEEPADARSTGAVESADTGSVSDDGDGTDTESVEDAVPETAAASAEAADATAEADLETAETDDTSAVAEREDASAIEEPDDTAVAAESVDTATAADENADDESTTDSFGESAADDFEPTAAFDDDFEAANDETDPFGDEEFGVDDDSFDDLSADPVESETDSDDDFEAEFDEGSDEAFAGTGDFETDDAGFDSPASASDADDSSLPSAASFGDDSTASDDDGDDDDVVRIVDEPEMEIPDISLPETSDRPDADDETDEIQSVRVDVEQIDSLLTLVEGLVTSRVRLRHAADSNDGGSALETELDALSDLTTDLQETVMDIRLVPLQSVTNRLPRVVRDIARDQDKEVAFEMTGEDVELDRSILDRIGDPLIHLVRNAVDHGIEAPERREEVGKPREGAVEVHADRSRDRVTITVEDDGSGLDPDRLRSEAVEAGILDESDAESLPDEDAYDLIFHPGLSTADEVTDVSGRGVGMDVVKRTIEDFDGTVSIDSDEGDGTTVTMTLPVTVAIDEILFVESGGEEFGVPTKAVQDIEAATAIETTDGDFLLPGEDGDYPVLSLADVLETPATGANGDGMVVRIRDEVREVALHCDHVHGQQEVVVKPFEGVMSGIPGISGATVRGRGEVVNILDVTTL